MNEHLLREWVRVLLLEEPVTKITADSIQDLLKQARTDDTVPAAISDQIAVNPESIASLASSLSGREVRELVKIMLDSGAGIQDLYTIFDHSEASDPIAGLLDFLDKPYSTTAKTSTKIKTDVAKKLKELTGRKSNEEALLKAIRATLELLMKQEGLSAEEVKNFKDQLGDGSKSTHNQLRFNFEGSFSGPVKKALKELTKASSGGLSKFEQALRDTIQKVIGNNATVVNIGRRSPVNVWTGGDYPGFLIVPNILKPILLDDQGKLAVKDEETMAALTSKKLVRSIMVITRTSPGIQNELDAAKDLSTALEASGAQTLSLQIDGLKVPLQISGAAHNSSKDPDIGAMVSSMKKSSGVSDVKPDMFLRDDAGVLKGISIKKRNAEYALSGDRILGGLVKSIIGYAKKGRTSSARKLADAINSGDVHINLETGPLKKYGNTIAKRAVMGAGGNKVDFVFKGDFSKFQPTVNNGIISYPSGKVKAYASFEDFIESEPYPSLVLRSAEGDRAGETSPDGKKRLRPVIMFTKARGKDVTDLISSEFIDPSSGEAFTSLGGGIGSSARKTSGKLGYKNELLLRVLIRETFLLEGLIKKMPKTRA